MRFRRWLQWVVIGVGLLLVTVVKRIILSVDRPRTSQRKSQRLVEVDRGREVDCRPIGRLTQVGSDNEHAIVELIGPGIVPCRCTELIDLQDVSCQQHLGTHSYSASMVE